MIVTSAEMSVPAPDGGVILPPKKTTHDPLRPDNPLCRPGDVVPGGTSEAGLLIFYLCIGYNRRTKPYSDFVIYNPDTSAVYSQTWYSGPDVPYKTEEDINLTRETPMRYPREFPALAFQMQASRPIPGRGYGCDLLFWLDRTTFISLYRQFYSGNLTADRTEGGGIPVYLDGYGTRWASDGCWHLLYPGVEAVESWAWRIITVKPSGNGNLLPIMCGSLLAPCLLSGAAGGVMELMSLAAMMAAMMGAASAGGRLMKNAEREENIDPYSLLS